MKTYTTYEVLRVADIRILLNISYSKANEYYNDIKDKYKCADVLFCHFKKYFNV